MSDRNKKVSGYQRTFKKYGVDARALQWTSKEAQGKRFRELVEDVDFGGKSVLDVGCGFGDIIPYIADAGFNYTGVDLVPEFIEVARERYPNHKFLVSDYFNKPLKTKFDIIITSGTLNANIKNPYEYRKKAIRIMWEHAKEVVAFNMAGGHPQPRNKKGNRVYNADSMEILKFCFTLTNRLIFRHSYSFNDFTIVLYNLYK